MSEVKDPSGEIFPNGTKEEGLRPPDSGLKQVDDDCSGVGAGGPGVVSCPQGGGGTYDHWNGGTQGGGRGLDTLPSVSSFLSP